MANRQLLRLPMAGDLVPDGSRASNASTPRASSKPATRCAGDPEAAASMQMAATPALCRKRRIELLVVGGSQSARVFGEVVPSALLALPDGMRRRLVLALQYKGDDADTIAAQPPRRRHRRAIRTVLRRHGRTPARRAPRDHPRRRDHGRRPAGPWAGRRSSCRSRTAARASNSGATPTRSPTPVSAGACRSPEFTRRGWPHC